MKGIFLLFCASLFAGNLLFAQYTLNGNAAQIDCHCYSLTNDDSSSQIGSIWNNNKISLTQSFDFWFDVFLGCEDSLGADGMAFVLQPISTSIGISGSGLGYYGVSPAVAVTIDTWQNGSPTNPLGDGDPYFDHIAIQLNGDLNHKDSIAPLPVNNIAGPVTALAGKDNIEDCQWHLLRIIWDEPTKTLSAYVDGVLRVSAVKDFSRDVFGGDPRVFWGFTGSTGDAKNIQKMCVALKPAFGFLPDQKKCVGEKISFFDSTITSVPIQKSYWDFGDGSPIDSVNVNPVHVYATAGNFTIVQKVLGADGCTAVNTLTITIGSVPLADFNFNNACVLDSTVHFNDVSSARYGTINNWFWDLGNGDTSTFPQLSKKYTTPGFKKVRLAVKSLEGCVSDTIEHLVQVYEKPVTGFTFKDSQCVNVPVSFKDISTVGDGAIAEWRWNTDSVHSTLAYTRHTSYAYTSPGQYTASLVTKSTHGCMGNIGIKPVNISPLPVAYFKNTITCVGAPVLFTDSSYAAGSGTIANWWWSPGNGSIITAKNADATYSTPGYFTVQLVVKSSMGCLSDTAKKIIHIGPKPLAKFGYALPVCENRPVLFSDSSLVNAGTILGWYWAFDDDGFSNIQNATAFFAAGNHQVKLAVQNDKGCNSDTTTAIVFVNPLPIIDFTVSSSCKNTNVLLQGKSQSRVAISQWQWDFGDGTISRSKDTIHVFTTSGTIPIHLFAVSSAGCYSDTVQRNIVIYASDAFAGNDTIAATNQPVQLQASGGISYQWRPAAGLSNPGISNPIAINNKDRSYILRAFTPLGCESFDTIHIKIYDGPEIYVPRAFTPNGDGLNELLKAMPVGVRQFTNFSVYNRLGQVVFSTNVSTSGWDGFFKGKAQNAGAFIWIASAVGYSGNTIFRRGTVLLIR